MSPKWSPSSFCFTSNFLVHLKIVSKWRRMFLLFFPVNLSAWLYCWMLITHSYCGSFLGTFWCSPGDSFKLWLCPWKLQLDYPIPLWESVLCLWIDLKEAFLKIYLRAYQISQAPHNYSLLNNLFCYQCYKHFSLLTILILSDFHFFIGFDYNIFPTLFSSTALYLIFSITLVNLLQSWSETYLHRTSGHKIQIK